MPWSLPTAYKGPAVIIGVGASFSFVGTVPVAITLALGVKTSATIIGVGFIGFGAMLILPGVCWCFVVQHRHYRLWKQHRKSTQAAVEETPALADQGQSYGGTEEYAQIADTAEHELEDEQS